MTGPNLIQSILFVNPIVLLKKRCLKKGDFPPARRAMKILLRLQENSVRTASVRQSEGRK